MRTLKPGRRPFIALGTICLLLMLLPLYLGIAQSKWTDAGKMIGCLLVLPVLFSAPIAFLRIEVDEEEIRLRNFGSIRKRVRFEDVAYSKASVLAERDWPVSVTIVGTDGGAELMSIGLKVLRKEDVTWLLALPQLKLRKNGA